MSEVLSDHISEAVRSPSFNSLLQSNNSLITDFSPYTSNSPLVTEPIHIFKAIF